MDNQRLISLKNECSVIDKEFYKTVKQMYKRVSKIFKLRMRSSTFPQLCMADLAKTMRDVGMIPTVKSGMAKVKEVWFKVKALYEEEPATAALPSGGEEN